MRLDEKEKAVGDYGTEARNEREEMLSKFLKMSKMNKLFKKRWQ